MTCKSAEQVCTFRVSETLPSCGNRKLEPYTFGRVRTEEHDKESRLAQVSVVKKGRWKLKALHIKVGGCKQFKIRVGLREKKLLVAHRLRKGAKKRNHQSNEPSKCKIRQQTTRDSCQRVQQQQAWQGSCRRNHHKPWPGPWDTSPAHWTAEEKFAPTGTEGGTPIRGVAPQQYRRRCTSDPYDHATRMLLDCHGDATGMLLECHWDAAGMLLEYQKVHVKEQQGGACSG